MQHVAKVAGVDQVHRSAEFDSDVDEIGVDLRSLEAEEEILQIMKTSKSQDNASLSMCSKTSSTSDDPERVHFYAGPEDSSKEIPVPSSFVSRLGDEPASNTKVVKSRGSPRIPSIRPSSGPLLPTKVLSAHQMRNNSAIPPAAASTDSIIWLAKRIGPLQTARRLVKYLLATLITCYEESSIQDLLIKAIRIAGRHDVTFPGGVVGRQACLYKIIDCIYVLGLRVGFEMTRTQLTPLFQLFFALFDRVPKPLDDMPQVRPLSTTSPSDKPEAVSGRWKSSEELNHRRGSNIPGTVNFIKPAVVLELQATFNKELARLAYIPFCRLAGGVFIDTCLYNTASVRALVSDDSGGSVPLSASSRGHSDEYSEPSSAPAHAKTAGTDATSVAARSPGFSQPQLIDRTQEMNLVASSSLYNDGGFHLRGMWSDVFRQELRASQNSDPVSKSRFRFHATRVASFVGHTAKVNSIDVMDTQNCFVTCSQDKTVQLWSLTDSYNPTYCMPPASTVISKSLTANSSAHSTLGPSSSGRNTPTDSFSAGNSSSSSGGTHIARLIFREHKKSVFAACYLSNYRLVASVDGHLILWDPCTGQKVHSGLGSRTLTALGRCSTPYGAIFCGDDAGFIYLVDPRAPVCSKSNLLRIDSGTRLAYAFLTKDRTKSANPVDGISNISQCSLNDYCSRLSGAHGDAFSQRLSALFCSVHPTSSHRTPSCSPSCNSVPLNCAGVLRHLVESEESRVLVCGFSSGFMTAIDLRTHQVVQAWRGHGDSVLALTESPQPTWFVSAGDRSLGFWHVKQSGEFTCLRTNDHCVTRSFATSEPVASSVGNSDMPEASFGSVPGMNHINCLCPNERELIVCGPPVPSGPSVSNVAAAVVAAVSSSTNPTDSLSSSPSSHPAQLRSASTNSGNQSNPVSTNGDILGAYFSSGTGLPIAYNSLGRIPSSLMRGHATSISSLSQTGLFLVGSSQGAISLLY
ncbi:unnamed protein product [Calicophoron daubneyi]|uniref:WD_REPEATS_REGION domain-containing protein n=1 Tax=Calicophoron daubneyi TaxID=300641 RepID=A0AAV2TSW8_CALDB